MVDVAPIKPKDSWCPHLYNLIIHRKERCKCPHYSAKLTHYEPNALLYSYRQPFTRRFKESNLHLFVALLSNGGPSSSPPPPSASSSLLPLLFVTPSMKFVNVSLMLLRRPFVRRRLLASPYPSSVVVFPRRSNSGLVSSVRSLCSTAVWVANAVAGPASRSLFVSRRRPLGRPMEASRLER